MKRVVSIIQKMTVASIIFFVPPGIFHCLNWQWSPNTLNGFSKYLFWITETAGKPWFIVTSVVLFLLFCLILKVHNVSYFIRLGVILALTLCIGQGIKLIVKNCSEQPRPYILWLEKTTGTPNRHFYSVNKNVQGELIYSVSQENKAIPIWLADYWQKETDYSFPSGHTIFATMWFFLAIIFICFYQHYLVFISIISWALLVEISRLLLGMHHPIDIFAGIIIAYLLSLGAYFCTKKWHIVKCLDS